MSHGTKRRNISSSESFSIAGELLFLFFSLCFAPRLGDWSSCTVVFRLRGCIAEAEAETHEQNVVLVLQVLEYNI